MVLEHPTVCALTARMERFLQLRTKYLVETGQYVGTMKLKVVLQIITGCRRAPHVARPSYHTEVADGETSDEK